MLPDDVYRTKLQVAADGIRRATERLGDAADVQLKAEPARLRLALAPRIRGACPLELMSRADQRYDIEIGTELYEDGSIGSFDEFEALIQAIANGNVVTRHHFSAATGSLRSVETVVTISRDLEWRRGHDVGSSPTTTADTLVKDRTFLPYCR